MSGKVILLSGMPSHTPAGGYKCTPIQAFSPVLKEMVTICKEHVSDQAIVQTAPAQVLDRGAPMLPPKRRRGRPKGTTVKQGAKRPRFASCRRDQVKWVKTKRGLRCRYTCGNNRSFVKNSLCEAVTKRLTA